MFPATAVPIKPVPMCAPNSRPSSASLGRSSAGWYRFFFPNWDWWTVACALKISCFTKGKFCNVNERVDQSTWLRSRQTVELPLACKLPRCWHVGDVGLEFVWMTGNRKSHRKGFRRDQHIVSTRTDARRASYLSIHKPIHKMRCLRRLACT